MMTGKVSKCPKCGHPMSAMSEVALLAAITDHVAICGCLRELRALEAMAHRC